MKMLQMVITKIYDWCYNVYQDTIILNIGKGEMDGTLWVIPEQKRITSSGCRVQYNLWSLLTREVIVSSQGICGTFLKNHLEVKFYMGPINDTYSSWAFNIKSETVAGLKTKGICPICRIDGKILIPQLEAKDVTDLKCLIQNHSSDDGNVSNRRNHARILQLIFTLTITSKTKYMGKGGGRPLLVNNTVSYVSTGGYGGDRAWQKKTEWP